MTDKNLGLAVSKREWIIEKCLDLLSNTNDYRKLFKAKAVAMLNGKNKAMEDLSMLAPESLPEFSQLREFLRSNCKDPLKDEIPAVPQFYGIPKIHKEPVKMRPIIPCHSACQNPAAKFCSKKLKPIIRSAPTIIHGTKDLAIKLSKVRLTPGRRFYIVTGDVVAFYPNIPINACLDIASRYYERHYGKPEWHSGITTPSLEHAEFLEQRDFFNRCLKLGNTDLICTFNNEYYYQLRGLAMGVADSPDLANLYGCWFEENCDIINHPLVPYYGRYIDDCLALVYASSEKEALTILSDKVKFDGCTIEWNASAYAQPFLDMLLYRDELGNLQHMPYRKMRNHLERIPWTSAHPLDVKRGTFIGEMSRIATLCSTREHYIGSMKDLVALYIKRGYPQNVVIPWLKSNISERWEHRLRETSREHGEVLVLKTEFNTAWNYFNAKELGDTILGYWREYAIRAEAGTFNEEFPKELLYRENAIDRQGCGSFAVTSRALVGPRADYGGGDITIVFADPRKIGILNRRVITSRKRTKNLFDMTSLWKKEVLRKLEPQVFAEMTARPETLAGPPRVPASDFDMSDVTDAEKNRRGSPTDMERLDPAVFLLV